MSSSRRQMTGMTSSTHGRKCNREAAGTGNRRSTSGHRQISFAGDALEWFGVSLDAVLKVAIRWR